MMLRKRLSSRILKITATIGLFVLFYQSCGVDLGTRHEIEEASGATTQGFSSSELASDSSAWRGADTAVQLLEDAGWCELPVSDLPKGWTHSELVRHMACVSNKESTFGRDTTGPFTGECGNAFGFWQIADCHMGEALRVNNVTYSCPARSTAELRDSAAVSARCALYVYVSSIHQLGNSGLGPWEATCSRSERFALRSDGKPIFREACSSRECAKSMNTQFDTLNETLTVTLGPKCGADQVVFMPISKSSQQTPQAARKTKQNTITVAIAQSQANFSFAGLRQQGFDAVRVILLENDREVFRTNPSLDFPVATPQAQTPAQVQTAAESTATPEPSTSQIPVKD